MSAFLATWGGWLGLVCVLLALWMAVHGMSLDLTAQDGMAEPPEACGSNCQEDWQQALSNGQLWMTAAAGMFVGGIVIASISRVYSRRTR